MNDKEREKLERIASALAARITSLEEWRDGAEVADRSDLEHQIQGLWRVQRDLERVPLTHGSGTGGN